ncbi:MAG: hypothetical protein ABIO51_07655 [Solirubrobacteraceae bacterium]
MLRTGRFPLSLHALVEYAASVAVIVAPFVLGFDDGTATAVSIVIGVLVLGIAASTDWPAALMRVIPLPFHLALDFALAGMLVASPFIFGFSDETAPTAFFIVLGVVHLLLTLGTRFLPDEEQAAEPVAPHEDDLAAAPPPPG